MQRQWSSSLGRASAQLRRAGQANAKTGHFKARALAAGLLVQPTAERFSRLSGTIEQLSRRFVLIYRKK